MVERLCCWCVFMGWGDCLGCCVVLLGEEDGEDNCVEVY